MAKSHTKGKTHAQQPPESAPPEREELERLDADLDADLDEHIVIDGEDVETVELPEDVAEMISGLQVERDDAVAARQRALADFCNFQRRAGENEQRALITGAAEIARAIVPVLDNFDLALEQDTSTVTVEQLYDGVKLVRDELFKALETHGLRLIEPEVGGEFDPNMHQAMLRQEAPDLEPNSVVQVLQVGYALGDLVLRAAKVAVSPSEDE